MKARFLFLAAVVLGLASCQTEPEGLDVNVGGEQLVTINVAVPEAETRAGGSNSALGVFDNGILEDDNITMRYILQVYYNGEASKERLVKYSDGKSVAFDVRLVPGRDYQFVVWADVVDTKDAEGKYVDNHYDTSDLTNVTLNNTWVAMDESRDAFTATEFIDNFNSSKVINITLKRPFAKLRVVTTDMKALNNLGIVPTKATVTYTEKHYGAFNAFAGKAIGDSKNRDIEHKNFAIVSYGENTAEGADMTLFTDYFFAEDDATNFILDVFDQDNKIIKSGEFTTDIYVKRNNLTTIKGNILTDGKGFDVIIDDAFAGESGKDDGETFAKVDTAEELLDAINKGVENITLEGDIDLNDLLSAGTLSTRASEPALVVSAENTMTIDLNGYTVSQTKTQTAAYSMITNKGTLTIVDTKGNGKLAYKDEGNGGEYVSNTIQNSGVLTIEGGIIENNSVEAVATNGYPHPIDNSGKLVINGGTFTNNTDYSSIRIWCTTDDDTEVIINGGTFNGCIDLQNVNTSANKGTLTINGGTFNADTYTKSAVRLLGFGNDVDEIFGYINGGTFNGKIKLNNYVGGEFNSQVFFIVGGTFSVDPSEFVVPGYKAEEENGAYVVRKPQALIDFENAIANGNDVTLSDDLTLIDPVAVPEGKEVTINLNGKTLSGVFTKGAGAVITNNATLKVVGGTIKSTCTNGDAAINNSGELILEDVKIEGAPLADGGYSAYAVISSGKITINEGTEISADRGCLKLSDTGETVINGGTFVNNDIGSRSLTSHVVDVEDGGSNKLTINGGTFEHRHATTSGGVVICNRTKGTVYVNGGNFSGGKYYAGNNNLSDYGYGGTFSVKGGTFTDNPLAKYIAEGYKVIEEDSKYNVVPDAVDDVVSSTETLNEAIAAGSDTIALNEGTYNATQITGIAGKTISFVGNGEDTVFDYSSQGYNSYVSGGNGDFTFENMTINRSTGTFAGMAHTNSTVYKNCVINGVYFVYEKNAQFIDCTFNITGDNYNCWLYGTEKVTYTNCTFNCDGKSIYVDGNGDTGSDAEFNNCTFNDINKVVTDKAAVETGTTYGKRYELVFNNAKVNGFNINPNGFVTGTTLWANKHSMPASKLKVTVDGKNAYNYVAAADNTTSFTNAITNGATEVTLSAGNYTMPEQDLHGKTLTITGTKDVVIDATAVNANDQFVTGATMVFDGVTINFGTTNYMGFANTASLTYKNCKINGLQFLYGENVTFENCELDSNGEHCVWTYGCKNVSFTECDFTYADRGVNCYSDNDVPGGQTVNFTNCTFTTEKTDSEGAVEINSTFITNGIVVNLDGCTAPAYGELAYVSPWDSTNGAKTTINIK